MWPFKKKDYSNEPTKSVLFEYRIMTEHTAGWYVLEFIPLNYTGDTENWRRVRTSRSVSLLVEHMRECIRNDNFKPQRIV
jgi:hypothetical protein